MQCPVCKQDMLVIEYHDVELDYCSDCQGVWFDSGELDLMLRAHGLEAGEPFRDEILNSPAATSAEKKRKCPICGRKMKKGNIGEPPVLIDACSRGHGIWFDGGEITQLVRHLTSEQLPEGGTKEMVINYIEEVFGA